MKSTSQILRDSFGIKFAALIVALAFTGSAQAQEQIQPETELQLPAQQVEQIDKDKLDKEEAGQDDKTGAVTPSSIEENKAISPSDLKQNKTVSPSELQDSDRLPAVQKDKLPAVQRDRLPESQRDKLPAVQGPQPISDDPVDAPFADGTALPDTGGPTPGKPDPELAPPDFSDALPDDAGKPDTGGPGAGGFVPKSVDLDPEVAFGEYPQWDRDYGQLHYGSNEKVSFTVVNGGESSTNFRAAYQIEKQMPQTSSTLSLDPGEEKPVSINVDLTSVSPTARKRLAQDQELTIRIFVAHGDSTGTHNYSGLLYRDTRVENHTWERDVTVRSAVDVSVELDRMRQYGLCEDWAQSRDWKFMINMPDEFFWYTLDSKPAFLDASVRATTSLAPPISYTISVDWHEGEITTTPLLYAMKNNGDIKNSGRSAMFEIRESLDTLGAYGSVTDWVRSRDRGGGFCGSNLELRYHLNAELVPPRS